MSYEAALERLLTRARMPALFARDAYGELPLAVTEVQPDGALRDWHHVQMSEILVAVKLAIIGEDDAISEYGQIRRRKPEKRVGKYGLKHGDGRTKNKEKAVLNTRHLFKRYVATAECAFLDACGEHEHDACDAFLLACQAAVVDFRTGKRAVRVAGFDPGTRNFAACVMELCDMLPRAGRPDAPDPVIKIHYWVLYDLISDCAQAEYAPAVPPRLEPRLPDDNDTLLVIQAERIAATKQRAALKRKERAAEKKRLQGPPAKKQKKAAATFIDLVWD